MTTAKVATAPVASTTPSVPKQKPAPQIKDDDSEEEEEEDDKSPPPAESANILAMRAR